MLNNPDNTRKIYYNTTNLFALLHACWIWWRKRLFNFLITQITQMLIEQKGHSDVNYFFMKQAFDCKIKHLQNEEDNMFLTVE